MSVQRSVHLHFLPYASGIVGPRSLPGLTSFSCPRTERRFCAVKCRLHCVPKLFVDNFPVSKKYKILSSPFRSVYVGFCRLFPSFVPDFWFPTMIDADIGLTSVLILVGEYDGFRAGRRRLTRPRTSGISRRPGRGGVGEPDSRFFTRVQALGRVPVALPRVVLARVSVPLTYFATAAGNVIERAETTRARVVSIGATTCRWTASTGRIIRNGDCETRVQNILRCAARAALPRLGP